MGEFRLPGSGCVSTMLSEDSALIEAFIESHGEDDRKDRILLIDIEKNCFACRHLHKDERTCDAFPGGIPTEYL